MIHISWSCESNESVRHPYQYQNCGEHHRKEKKMAKIGRKNNNVRGILEYNLTKQSVFPKELGKNSSEDKDLEDDYLYIIVDVLVGAFNNHGVMSKVVVFKV